jgi:cytosine/adenosine deaminase-related metal-dependent hydrolase
MDDAGTEMRDASIAIVDGWITEVSESTPASVFDEVVDCRGLLAVPGLVNTHHHLYQTLTRGFPAGEGRTLFDWLRLLYPIWAGLDEDMIYCSTRTGLAELALSGCTTAADHLYLYPDGSDGFFDAQVEAARSIGLRFHPARGSMDLGENDGGLPPQSVVQSREAIVRDCVRIVDRYHDPSPGSMLQVALAPCSPFSATPELMKETAELARDSGVRLHTHIAETTDEEEYSRQHFGLPPVALLESLGWLGPDVWLAHCVHVHDGDRRLMARTSTSVAHCPTSNMLLGSGLAPVRALLDLGINVGLGVDGSASNDANDLRQEVKQSILSARTRDGVRALSVREALRLATRGGAACLGRDDIGTIAPGKCGDIILLELNALGAVGADEDPLSGAILASPRVHSVFVHGKKVVAEGSLLTEDEDLLALQHKQCHTRLMEHSGYH